MQLTKSDDCQMVRECAQCLALLGPLKLQARTFNCKPVENPKKVDDKGFLTHKIVRRLLQFLRETEPELRRLSSTALYSICTSIFGKQYLSENIVKRTERYQSVFKGHLELDYIRPFLTPKCNELEMQFSLGALKTCFQPQQKLWTRDIRGKHDEWVIELTCGILGVFQHPYFENLAPVAR